MFTSWLTDALIFQMFIEDDIENQSQWSRLLWFHSNVGTLSSGDDRYFKLGNGIALQFDINADIEEYGHQASETLCQSYTIGGL